MDRRAGIRRALGICVTAEPRMTVAAKIPLAAPRRKAVARPGNPWRRLWQIPLLLAGVTAFGLGLRTFIRAIRLVPFDKQSASLQSLIDAGQYAKAIEELNKIAPYYAEPAQQALLQQYAGDAIYLAQRQQPVLVRENYEQVKAHYADAVAWGMHPSAQMNERWGDAAMALGEAKTAIEKLEAAIEASGNDAEMVQRHTRELTAAYLDAGERDKARAVVDRMLDALKKAPPADEIDAMEQATWGLSKRIEIALATGDIAALKTAVEDARDQIKTFKQRDPQGRVLVWIGRAELEQENSKGAADDLALARKDFAVHHLDDGRAAILLARLATSKGSLDEAAALFAEVCTGQEGTSVWAAARLGRADVASRKGVFSGETLLADYRYAIATLKERDQAPIGRKPEFISTEDVRRSLYESYQRARDAAKYEEALTFLAMEQETEETLSIDNALRRASTRELRSGDLLQNAAKLDGPEQKSQLAAGRAMLTQAAQDYLQHAALTTLSDDVSGNSLWKAAELLDRAGQTTQAIAVYDRITIQRPRDSRVPEGLLALGRLYESAGMIDKALASYERNVRETPTVPAAYMSQVSQARCYVTLARQAADFSEKQSALNKAEKILLGLVQDNTNLLPNAPEFRDSLLALAEMYCQSRGILYGESSEEKNLSTTQPAATAPAAVSATAAASAPASQPAESWPHGRWGDAILRLDEFLERYPNDPATARVLFLLAESYRQSAGEIREAMRNDASLDGRSELEHARTERLLTATDYFGRVIGLLDAELSVTPESSHPLTPLEQIYLQTSYMDRAQCLFARGDYDQAIRRYTEAAARFSEDVLAVDAYVQIVNSYLAMNQPAQAAAAADRGRWILKRVPDDAFRRLPPGGADRAQYEKLLSLGKT